jgi:uncharacterized membrane protein YkgB
MLQRRARAELSAKEDIDMTTRDMTVPFSATDERWAPALAAAGTGVLRYGLVALLLLWGSFKFAAFEAEAIRPLVENSPFVSWMYAAFGVRGTSAVFGVVEVGAAVAIALRRWLPRASAYGSLVASGVFVVTLTFLFTTPGAFSPDSPWGGFLMKDLVLLGAAWATAGEAIAAPRR